MGKLFGYDNSVLKYDCCSCRISVCMEIMHSCGAYESNNEIEIAYNIRGGRAPVFHSNDNITVGLNINFLVIPADIRDGADNVSMDGGKGDRELVKGNCFPDEINK